MRKIKLNQLTRDQLEVLQNELQKYSIDVFYIDCKNNFIDAIISLDIIYSLYFILRNRLESHRLLFNINLKPSEAAVILKCILKTSNKDPFTVAFFENIKELIDKQLKAIVS